MQGLCCFGGDLNSRPPQADMNTEFNYFVSFKMR